MSLINDALKRAKQAQQQGRPSASPTLEFRPVEPVQQRGRRLDWVAPAVVALVAVFALVFMWPWSAKNPAAKFTGSKSQLVVAGKEIATPAPAAPVAITPAPLIS